MADHVWNLSEERIYDIGIAGDWRQQMTKFLRDSSFKVVTHRPNRNILKAEQRGVHVNFKPVVKIHVMMDDRGAAKVHCQYYARVKYVSAVAVGVLTGGISTLVGAGTFANHVSEARDFFSRLWFRIEQLTGSSHQVVPQTVVVNSPNPAPIIQQTTTTYNPYNTMYTQAPVSQTMTYNASHLYSAPAPLLSPPAPTNAIMYSHQQYTGSVVPPQPAEMTMHIPGMMPPPQIMSLPPPPLPSRTQQQQSSWQQYSTQSYQGWGPQ